MNAMEVALSILALLGIGAAAEMIAAARSPLGFQDEDGFHFGTRQPEYAEAPSCANRARPGVDA